MSTINNSVINRILALLAASLLLAACGKDEPDEAAVEQEPVAAEDEAANNTATEATEEAVEETLEVVEESAAVETEDEGDAEIVLARAETAAPPVSYQYEEGQHYIRLVPTQPTIGGADKIEVAEFFWYGCPHCYDLEPTINAWDANKPSNVRFVKVPAMWNQALQIHAQLFYTEEVLVRNGTLKDAKGFRNAVFEEYHRRGNRLLSQETIARLFERYGVTAADFEKTWGSFEVSQKLRVASDLARRYSIASVPAIVVNGKYRTGAAEAGSYPKLIEVIDELIARESAR